MVMVLSSASGAGAAFPRREAALTVTVDMVAERATTGGDDDDDDER